MGRFWCGGLRFRWVAVWGSWALKVIAVCGGYRVVVAVWGGCSVGKMQCEGDAVGKLFCWGVKEWRSSVKFNHVRVSLWRV